jgi:hypothetical protein
MKFVSAYTSLTENKEDLCCPTLTFQERMIGFGVCFVVGILIEFLSFGSLIGLFSGNASRFAILFSLGNIISITGTFFLIGPKRQLKNMTDKKRLFTTLIFVASVAMTIISVYVFESWLLTILCVSIQFMAYIWYVLSYIPYGRECCSGCLKNFCCSKNEGDSLI